MTPSLEMELVPHWWEASSLTTTPTLLLPVVLCILYFSIVLYSTISMGSESIESLRNRTAGRSGRKNAEKMWHETVHPNLLRDIFSLFCRPESNLVPRVLFFPSPGVREDEKERTLGTRLSWVFPWITEEMSVSSIIHGLPAVLNAEAP